MIIVQYTPTFDCLVLSRGMGEWVIGTTIGDLKGLS